MQLSLSKFQYLNEKLVFKYRRLGLIVNKTGPISNMWVWWGPANMGK